MAAANSHGLWGSPCLTPWLEQTGESQPGATMSLPRASSRALRRYCFWMEGRKGAKEGLRLQPRESFGSAQAIESVAQVIACNGPRRVLLEEEADGMNNDVRAGRGADPKLQWPAQGRW